jgi:hypothetical protein
MNEKQSTTVKRVVLGFLALIAIALLISTIMNTIQPVPEDKEKLKNVDLPVVKKGEGAEGEKPADVVTPTVEGQGEQPADAVTTVQAEGIRARLMGLAAKKEVRIGMIVSAVFLAALVVGIVLYQMREAQLAQGAIMPSGETQEQVVVQTGPTQEELDKAQMWHRIASGVGALSAGLFIVGLVILWRVISTVLNHGVEMVSETNTLDIIRQKNWQNFKGLTITSAVFLVLGIVGSVVVLINFPNAFLGSVCGAVAIASLAAAAFILLKKWQWRDLLGKPREKITIMYEEKTLDLTTPRRFSAIFLVISLVTAALWAVQAFNPALMGMNIV